MQRGVDGSFWPSVLHFFVNVNRKNLSAVNNTHKNKFKNFSGRQDKPLDKEGDRSLIALESIDLPRLVGEIFSLVPKQPVRYKLKKKQYSG